MSHISVHVFVMRCKPADFAIAITLFPKGLHCMLMLEDILSMVTRL